MTAQNSPIIVGAENISDYLPSITNKRIGICANKSSIVNGTNIIDFLISEHNININTIFTPEHGFDVNADANQKNSNYIDLDKNIRIVSLYNENYLKPRKDDLDSIDIMLFDIQDVGVRFFTYISTLHYVMEACGENNIPLIVLDRPNPNIHYIDGPILETQFKSFVGMHPVPIVYGMTIGEYALMINGEGWLNNSISCKLSVIKCSNYTRQSMYINSLSPSPNLPNATAINLYPSLCLFEGTNVSVGRGTLSPFQIFGSPYLPKTPFSFTPKPSFGASNPLHKDIICYGFDLKNYKRLSEIKLDWLIYCYKNTTHKSKFFNNFFVKLSGTHSLKRDIINNLPIKEIKNSWQKGINAFRKMSSKYYLYK